MAETVVVGCVGPVLDRAKRGGRWGHWRPSVAVCQQQDVLVDRYILVSQDRFEALGDELEQDIRSISPETEIDRHSVQIRDAWDFQEVYGALYDLARKLNLDPGDENLVHITTGSHVMQICLFLLTESRDFPAKLLQTSPPKRPSGGIEGTCQKIDLDLARYNQLATRFEQSAREDISYLKSGIETRNRDFNKIIERIEEVALRSTEPILLMGPTGAGKSRLARRVFDLATQRRAMTGEFVEVNCATLRGQTAMSSLFGHKKGAYTGATSDRPGLLRAADQGILFLDEIGELGLDEQATLLHAIEEKVFYPLGSDTAAQSDFQLICGTNRDLQQEVRAGRFREDLLARIQLWTFRLPGLAERREDIEPNLDFELDQYAQKTGRRVRFNKEAARAFLKFATAPDVPWSGNFRDLNGAILRMATLAPEGRITETEVREEIERLRQHWSGSAEAKPHDSAVQQLLDSEGVAGLDLFDRLQLEGVLRVCHRSNSLAAAGRELFAASRAMRETTNDSDRIRKYLARFGLKWVDIQETAPESNS